MSEEGIEDTISRFRSNTMQDSDWPGLGEAISSLSSSHMTILTFIKVKYNYTTYVILIFKKNKLNT